jgi:tRNA modification GTPase
VSKRPRHDPDGPGGLAENALVPEGDTSVPEGDTSVPEGDTSVPEGDTVSAIATAPGQGGVGIVRVSGPLARTIAETVTDGRVRPREALFRRFLDGSGEPIDSGLILFFQGPASFTGEDVAEFQGHGGPVVLSMILDRALECGARLARPGEFTERAYLNGKLDLAQAEAVADLIGGATEEAVRGANRSLAGEFSRRVHAIDRAVVDLRMFVEAAIDFPDEDIDLLADGQVQERLTAIRADLGGLLDDCAQGVILRDGVRLALIGPPNVGKSSLLNRLAGESRAIVTDIPGTTRDLVRADLSLDGLAVEVVDTAGLREASDAVEAEGVRRALTEADQADLVIALSAYNSTKRSFDHPGWPDSLDKSRVIPVLNKIDLADHPENLVVEGRRSGFLALSAETGQGVAALKAEIVRRSGYRAGAGLFTARKRHLAALQRAIESLDRTIELAAGFLPGELVAEELRGVHIALGEIVGEMSSDELLGEIFSRFCIGK